MCLVGLQGSVIVVLRNQNDIKVVIHDPEVAFEGDSLEAGDRADEGGETRAHFGDIGILLGLVGSDQAEHYDVANH